MELKPCQWCETSKAEVVDKSDFFGGWFAVACCECFARGPAKETPEEAMAAWNTRATDAELERLRADLARVTAERDDYRSRWEQTGCTRHHAMETAIKLNESCQEQLESVIQERDRLREALDFYACVDHYAGGCADDVVSTDRGAKARAALNAEGEG